ESVDFDDQIAALEKRRGEIEKLEKNYTLYQEARDDVALKLRMSLQDKKRNEDRISKLQDEVNKIKSGEGTNCVACGQEITAATLKHALEHTLNEVREAVTEKNAILNELTDGKEKL